MIEKKVRKLKSNTGDMNSLCGEDIRILNDKE